MGKPAFEDALKDLAARRRRMAEHPSPDELLAYHVGELPSEEIERVQDHLAVCGECTQLVLSLGPLSHPEAGAKALSIEQGQVDSAWKRLQGQAEVPAQKTPAKIFPFSLSLREVAALAAAFLVGALGVSLWRMAQEIATSPGNLGGGSHIVDLVSASLGTTRGSQPVEEVPRGRLLNFALSLPPDPVHSLYRVELTQPSASGSEILWQLRLRRSRDTLNVWLPHGLLDSGSYRFQVWGLQGGEWELVDGYSVRLEFQ